MRFYRVEDREGVGPYQHEICRAISDVGEFDFREHPGPLDDKGMSFEWRNLDDNCPYRFGFVSMEQTRWWWDRGYVALWMLNEAGFGLSVYEVSGPVIQGTCQAVAILQDAELIDSLDLRTCFQSTKGV